MLTDEVIITIEAGKGGDGLVSFRREKFVPKGGPDGGDGGAGGDVYFKVERAAHTLTFFNNRKRFKAEDGEAGRTKKQHGSDGEDLFLSVPPGTLIWEERKGNWEILRDLTQEGELFMVAGGGQGGRGNPHFATSTYQTPRVAELGTPGKKKHLKLELKILADVGLIGLPNVGKSTMLSRISAAKPKIANYPFTTLTPNLGVTKIYGQEFVVADIPGLIEGAAKGKGLGDRFLKHIERTKLLVHVLDGLSADLKRDYQTVRAELEAWSKLLLKKEELIVVNKSELLNKPQQAAFKRLFPRKQLYFVSAVTGAGLDKLLGAVHKLCI